MNLRAEVLLLLLLPAGCSAYRVSIQGVDFDRMAESAGRDDDSSPETRSDRHNDRGVIRERTGDLRGALTEYREALRLCPGHARTWINLGNAWVKLGNPPEAIAAYRRALELEPDHPHALNNLACVILDSGGNPGEALALLERALAADPDNRRLYLDSLGWARFLAGDPEAAETTLREALDSTPEEFRLLRAETLYHLGRVREAGGAPKEAQKLYRDALELAPPESLEREILRSLEPPAP